MIAVNEFEALKVGIDAAILMNPSTMLFLYYF